MPELLGNWGLNIGSNIIGGIGNLMFGKIAAERNAQINHKYNELSAEAADKRTRALYEDYMQPASRIRQLKEAGLSPSLYADGAGGGSMGITQGAQGEGASGIGLPTNILNTHSLAETRLLNAQADKAETEANTLKGETPQGEANVAETWSKVGLNKAVQQYTKAQEIYQRIQNRIANSTESFVIYREEQRAKEAAELASKAFWDAADSELTWRFKVENFEKQGELIAKQCAELAARTALEESHKELNEAEKQSIYEYIKQGWAGIGLNAINASAYAKQVNAFANNLPKQLELKSQELNVEKWKIGVNAITDLIRTAGYVFGATQLGDGGYTTAEEVLEYDKGYAHTKSTKTTTKTRLPKKIR